MTLPDKMSRQDLSSEIRYVLNEIERLLGVFLKNDSLRDMARFDDDIEIEALKQDHEKRDKEPKFRIFRNGMVQVRIDDRVIQLEPNSTNILCRPRLLNQFIGVSDVREAISYLIGKTDISSLRKIKPSLNHGFILKRY